ncbi:MAG: BON domain-containing protein [Polyangiaceae bacterium]|nr:BON domain-containing protein [Polyangiaceae bacterium]
MTRARAALVRVPGLDVQHPHLGIGFSEGILTIEGDAPTVAAKKRILRAVAALPEVRAVADQLRVAPAVHREDGEIRAHVVDALLAEPAFEECSISEREGGEARLLREPPAGARGAVEAHVREGVVTLDGRVPSLSHKRIAGVLAWWVPGTRDGVNILEIVPPQEDDDGEISDAVRLVMEKDPFLDAVQIGVRTERSVVRLSGTAASEEQRRMAERDAWCVWGVDEVVDEMEVRSELQAGQATRRA